MPGNITIFRFTNAGDTLVSIADSEKVEFDVDVDPNLKTTHCHEYAIEGGRDVAQNAIADQDLAEHQDTGLGDEKYTYLLSIAQRSDGAAGGVNAEAQKLENFWQDGSETDDFPAGRFGVLIKDFAIKTLNPTATKGLYFTYRKWYVDPELPGPIFLLMTFSENRDS